MKVVSESVPYQEWTIIPGLINLGQQGHYCQKRPPTELLVNSEPHGHITSTRAPAVDIRASSVMEGCTQGGGTRVVQEGVLEPSMLAGITGPGRTNNKI